MAARRKISPRSAGSGPPAALGEMGFSRGSSGGLGAGRAVALVTPYFEFAARERQLDAGLVGAVKRGNGLFFLAHAHVLAAPGLGLEKLARLTCAYHQLDFPDDEAAAQRLASALLQALSRHS